MELKPDSVWSITLERPIGVRPTLRLPLPLLPRLTLRLTLTAAILLMPPVAGFELASRIALPGLPLRLPLLALELVTAGLPLELPLLARLLVEALPIRVESFSFVLLVLGRLA